jgi:hypothetical protein
MEGYLVEILEGSVHECYHNTVFVTEDKEKAENWINRFNSIIDLNRRRISDNYDKDIYCLWCDYVIYESPFAKLKIIELR